jgi:lipopolysaccharide export system protein LptC
MNPRAGTQLMPLAAVIVLAALTFWLLQSNLSQPTTPPAGPKRHTPDYFADNLSITMLDQAGRTQYRINAQNMVHYEDTADTDVQMPAIRAFMPGRPQVTSTARRGVINADGSVIDLYDTARVVRDPGDSDPGMRADSEHFRVLVNEDIVQTEKPVKLMRGLSVMTANGMTYNNVTREMHLAGQVRGIIAASDTAAGRSPHP